jgi:hypothetical protein
MTKKEEAASACDMILTGLVRLGHCAGDPEKRGRAAEILEACQAEVLHRLEIDPPVRAASDDDSMMADVFLRLLTYLYEQ